MHLSSFYVRNFRRLKAVKIDLSQDSTIFVGANNTGKTSATHIFQLFFNPSAKFSIHDFSADCWSVINSFDPAKSDNTFDLPSISLDLWFTVDEENLHRVIDLLPDLDWQDTLVGIRIAFEPIDPLALYENFRKAHESAKYPPNESEGSYRAWPCTMHDYLSKKLTQEYRTTYHKLDPSGLDKSDLELAGSTPLDNGSRILASIMRVDFLDAQRYLADVEARGRAEDLSKRMSRFYQRNLKKHDPDIDALRAIAESEERLNAHFAQVFEPTLGSLRRLGYPGLTNPELVIKTELRADTLLSGSAQVHYVVPGIQPVPAGGADITLPDRYNGLGFKNLIYMVVEILDHHHSWLDESESRPPIHLVIVEEPEAHLHAQLQQVFIRQIRQIVGGWHDGVGTQFVITTHSSHIIYEDFRSIRYFRRFDNENGLHFTEVRNLSTFYNKEEPATREFLLKYLKLTHCDLFFADAAILVEGNVERLLLPLIIAKSCNELEACHLTILEVGGAFAHKFRELIDFLGITTLIITDLDSMAAESGEARNGEGVVEAVVGHAPKRKPRPKACLASTPGAVTSNPILKEWLPGLASIEDLLDVGSEKKVAEFGQSPKSAVRVAYQTLIAVTWRDTTTHVAGRTFEESFAFENLDWCQDASNGSLDLIIDPDITNQGLEAMLAAVFERVRTIDKTQFALALMNFDRDAWVTPTYIAEGLGWLAEQLNVRR
ncbi:ATP-dependent endonuclease [Micromonospora sp. NPDC047527]|uniref:ATP-dependent endonuclease n=1 Tax=Micromonospora sp. NPDC047527 TaxID=3155144 RepID=UPI003406F429